MKLLHSSLKDERKKIKQSLINNVKNSPKKSQGFLNLFFFKKYFKYAKVFLICPLTLAIHKHPLHKPEISLIYELILSFVVRKKEI